jgi:type VI secretion system protein ImpH
MDDPAGSSQHALTPLGTLCSDAPAYDFYELVRLLHRFTPAVGKSVAAGEPNDEVVRFRGSLATVFAASDVHELSELTEDHAYRMLVNFAGIANPIAVGALPAWYASLARGLETGAPPQWWVRSQGGTASNAKRPELRAFFDVFDDRLIGLMYRAWRRHFLPAQHEAAAKWAPETTQPRRASTQDWAFTAMLAVLGLYTQHQRSRLNVDVRALVWHAGALGRRPVTAQGLADLLGEYFKVPVQVLPFTAPTTVLPPQAQLRLDPGAGFALGKTTILGARVVLAQSGFRVRLGPLDLAMYKSFLPASAHTAAGDGHRALSQMVRFAVGPEFDFDLQLVLRAQDVPELQFDRSQAGVMLLGWSTWLGVRPPAKDADDTVIPMSA